MCRGVVRFCIEDTGSSLRPEYSSIIAYFLTGYLERQMGVCRIVC